MGILIAVLNTKGGVTKTTTSITLANSLTKFGSVLLKDSDPQASATEWIDIISESHELPFDFEITNRSQLSRNKDKYDFIIIDTPPQDRAIVDAAVKVADFIIIPIAPTGLDISRALGIVELMGDNKNFGVLITQADARTKTYKQTRSFLDMDSINAFDTFIPHLESIKQGFGKLINDPSYDSLAEELINKLKTE